MESEDITLKAADGTALAATFYRALSDQFIVVASATAVPRGFYRRFAQFVQQQGVNVITVDYRGIGGSAPESLRGFMPEYADWSRLDLAAAVDFAAARGRVWLVGHSLGGHAIGQLPDPNLLQAAYVCGTGAGWHGYMTKSEQRKVWLMWNVIGPLATRLLGYQPMSRLGMGEDIPVSIYRQWKRWCGFPRYFFDDPEAAAITAPFAGVKIPIAASVSVDDLWAPPASRDAFFSGYVNAQVERIDLTPQKFGVSQIGHMGYFRAAVGAHLWPQIMNWLGTRGLQFSAARAAGTTADTATDRAAVTA
jgi:predicted alpha/beta hydrolase